MRASRFLSGAWTRSAPRRSTTRGTTNDFIGQYFPWKLFPRNIDGVTFVSWTKGGAYGDLEGTLDVRRTARDPAGPRPGHHGPRTSEVFRLRDVRLRGRADEDGSSLPLDPRAGQRRNGGPGRTLDRTRARDAFRGAASCLQYVRRGLDGPPACLLPPRGDGVCAQPGPRLPGPRAHRPGPLLARPSDLQSRNPQRRSPCLIPSA